MGCAASRAACEGEEIPPKVRPVIHRRFNELRQKKKSGKNDFIDEKKLLRGDQERREVERSSRSSSSHYDSLQKLKQPLLKTTEPPKVVAMPPIAKENNAVLKEEEEKHESGPVVKEEKSMKRESNVEKSFEEKIKVAVAESKEEEEEEEEEEEGEDEGRMLCKNNEPGYDCPGSPSFRVYCVESIETVDAKGHSDEEIDLTHEEIHEDCGQDHNSSHNQEITPIKSVQDPETSNNVRKKGKKGRGFGRVMPKAGRAAVKNLWRGKSCYVPSSSCLSHHHHHDKTHLLPNPTT